MFAVKIKAGFVFLPQPIKPYDDNIVPYYISTGRIVRT